MQTLALWSVPMFVFIWPHHQTYQSRLKSVCDDLQQNHPVSGIAVTAKHNLYESRFDFCHLPHDAVRAWTDWIKDCVFEAARAACGSEWPAGLEVAVNIHESWCHITHDYGYHDMHIHGNSSWSGIYYLDAAQSSLPDRNGVNRFYRPWHSNYVDAGTAWATKDTTIDVNPQDGMLVIFPSWIPHAALAYRGDQSRYILSFNSQTQAIK